MAAQHAPATIGNYVLSGELAKGGMATIHIGHAVGSAVPVAIKRLYTHGASPELVTMFLDEIALARSVRHPNIVPTIDVISTDDDLCLVMEYIEGETLSKLLRACHEQRIAMPLAVAASIVFGTLNGLQAAHEATDERGRPLEIVHRDVSPQNVIVGVDGVARLLDFGVAKTAVKLAQTRTGELKGKVAYMAPEQLDRHSVGRATDVYATGILLWEALAGRRLYEAETEGQLVLEVLRGAVYPPSRHRPEIPPELDTVVMRALSFDPDGRFASARQFATALAQATPVARSAEVADLVQNVAKETLAARARRVAELLGSAASASAAPIAPLSTPSLRTPRSKPSIPSSVTPHPSAPRSGDVTGTSSATVRKTEPRHVLIIDDSQVILDNARRALEAEGYRVTTTTQTVGAARYLIDCDLALVDFHMPGFNGASVIESLRAAAASSNRSCLFYLYTSDPEVAKDYARVGFDGALTGKGDEDSLVRGVRAAFRVLQMRAMRK
jgi:eukaryotic-like serine/threonine-protein kinase